MTDNSIRAYDLPQRIAGYDADMDVMHPNRRKMVEIAVQMTTFTPPRRITILDLGIGTGFFSWRFLQHFPNAEVIAVDGAASMIEAAKERLGVLKDRVDFRVGDFRDIETLLKPDEGLDLVISAYALHHLDGHDKARVLSSLVTRLRPGGQLINADLIIATHPLIEERFQQLRAEGCVKRAPHDDQRFADVAATRTFLSELEKAEGDQPLTLLEDLAILKAAGLAGADVFWLETREAVTGGVKA